MGKRVKHWKTVAVFLASVALCLVAAAPTYATSLSQVAQSYLSEYGSNGPVVFSPVPGTSTQNSAPTGNQNSAPTGNQNPVPTVTQNPASAGNLDLAQLAQSYLSEFGSNGKIVYFPASGLPASTGNQNPAPTGNQNSAPTGNQNSASGTGTTSLPSLSNIWANYSSGYSLNASEQQLLTLVNQQRVANHEAPFTVNLKLSYLARLRAQEMADSQDLTHYLAIYGTPPQMEEAAGIYGNPMGAENICEGGSVVADNSALFASAPHRANLLDAQETQIGLGVVKSSNGIVWVSELFLGN